MNAFFSQKNVKEVIRFSHFISVFPFDDTRRVRCECISVVNGTTEKKQREGWRERRNV